LSKFYPDIYTESVKHIDFIGLQRKGIKALLFDIDNTLATYDEPTPNAEIVALMRSLADSGFGLALISNNSKQRVDTFADGLDNSGIHTISKAHKPLKSGFKKAIEYMNLVPSEIAIVGDQILTDILGGNRCGLYTILVSPLAVKENLFFKVKRFIEKIILNRYLKKEHIQ